MMRPYYSSLRQRVEVTELVAGCSVSIDFTEDGVRAGMPEIMNPDFCKWVSQSGEEMGEVLLSPFAKRGPHTIDGIWYGSNALPAGNYEMEGNGLVVYRMDGEYLSPWESQLFWGDGKLLEFGGVLVGTPPVLAEGVFSDRLVDSALEILVTSGSLLPGARGCDPAGVVVRFSQTGETFQVEMPNFREPVGT